MSEFYRCSICGNPMFAGYLCPKCSANGLKSCEVKTTNWQEQKTIAELQKRIDELEAQLRWRPVSEGNLPATNVKVEKTKQCRSCHGTGTVWLMGSIHGEDVCEKCGGVGWIEVKHE